MTKKPKKNKPKAMLNVKKLGNRQKRIGRKVATDPKKRKRLFAACAATLAQDRDRHFDSLLSSWEQPESALRAATAAILANPSGKIDADVVSRFPMAWDPILVRLFQPLAGSLTESEARPFRLRVRRLAEAWHEFAATFATLRPEMRDAAMLLNEAADLIAAHVAAIYLGEREPLFDGDCEYMRLANRYHALAEPVASALTEGGRP